MRPKRRSELFPPDRGLQARMVLAAVLTPAVAVGGIAAVAVLGSTRMIVCLVIVLAIAAATLDDDADPELLTPSVTVEEWPHLHAVVERLCVLADLPKPGIVVEPELAPNSWTTLGPDGRPRLHLTYGLIRLLPPAELEAVIGHELAHVAHRDAVVLGLVGSASELLLRGARKASNGGLWFFMWPGMAAAWGLGWSSRLGALCLSRGREFAADAASAALTRRPAELASALRRITGELDRVPRRDLRVGAGRDMLGLLPVRPPEGDLWGLTDTHPAVAKRIERLERLEREMHAARRV